MMKLFKQIAALITVLCFVCAQAHDAPVSLNPALMKSVSKQYRSFRSLQELTDWVLKLTPENQKAILLTKIAPYRSAVPLKLSWVGEEFRWIDGSNSYSMKVVDPENGKWEINHHLVTVSLSDVQATWEQVEKALPRHQKTAFIDLFLPRAEADSVGFLVAIAAMGAIAANATVQIYLGDEKVKKNLKECDRIRSQHLFENGIGDLETTFAKIIKMKNDESECKTTQDNQMCKNQKHLNACVAEIETQYCARFACPASTSAKQAKTQSNLVR